MEIQKQVLPRLMRGRCPPRSASVANDHVAFFVLEMVDDLRTLPVDVYGNG
jgi:hypothetical protein